MTLEDYLRRVAAEGAIDHSLRCHVEDDRVTFYIYPSRPGPGDQYGPTVDFTVAGNKLEAKG
tara:strand:+ start:1264 stop:1449 length:186 start_codon:yes stop_codon:yes gene_type:complete